MYDEDARGLLYGDLMQALQNLRLLDVVGGEFVFMQPSGFETDRGNATARHIDRGWRGRVTVPRRVSLA